MTVDRVVSFCGQTRTGLVFPNTFGYAALNDAAVIVTSYWDNNYVSIHTSQQTTSTLVHHAAWFTGDGCAAAVMYCVNTKELFSATITHFTVYAPSGNIETLISAVTSTVTTTATLTATLTYTKATTATVTETSTSISVALSTFTTTELDTSTITKTVTDDGTCPAVDTKTVTTSVTYNIGTGSELTIYTSGLVPGTSTYYSCFT